MSALEILDAAIAEYEERSRFVDGPSFPCPTCPVTVELEPYEALAIRSAIGGFTQEDVRFLRWLSVARLRIKDTSESGRLSSLASRIEALLPPEET